MLIKAKIYQHVWIRTNLDACRPAHPGLTLLGASFVPLAKKSSAQDDPAELLFDHIWIFIDRQLTIHVFECCSYLFCAHLGYNHNMICTAHPQSSTSQIFHHISGKETLDQFRDNFSVSWFRFDEPCFVKYHNVKYRINIYQENETKSTRQNHPYRIVICKIYKHVV